MTTDEFRQIAADIQARWFHFQIPKTALVQLGVDLAHLTAEQVRAAVDTLEADGLQRAPTGGQIRRRVAELELGVEPWAIVKGQLIAWRQEREAKRDDEFEWSCPHGECEGSGWVIVDDRNEARRCSCMDARIAAVRHAHALPQIVVDFIRECASWEEIAVVAGGDTTAEAQMRSKWLDYVNRAVTARAHHGDTAALPALERGRRDDRERLGRQRVRGELPAGTPHHLDPLRSLSLDREREQA